MLLTAPTAPPAASATRPEPETLGDLRVGRRSITSARAASIAFEYVGSGPASTRSLVPLTDRARLLAASPAGPRLERALQRFASQADAHVGADNLRTITLAPDVDAVVAAAFHGDMQGPDGATLPLTTPLDGSGPALQARLNSYRTGIAPMDGVNGAFNANGNIVLLPDYGRMLLASVGAYDPSPTEKSGRAPRVAVEFLPHLMRHEVEHSVTSYADYGTRAGLDGLEEGIAETLSSALPASAAGRHDLPPSATRYGRTDRASASSTTGWRPYPARSEATNEKGDASNAVYEKRNAIVGDLLHLAGVDRHTRIGYAQARAILQGHSMTRVPGAVADAIIAEHGLPATIRESLRTRIRDITESPSTDPVADLRTWLGVDATT